MTATKFARQKIVVLGTGYVGLPVALLLARAGHEVIGVDIDENIVRAINDGVLLIKEQELQTIMNEPRVRSNLHAQSTPCEADVFLVAVPTPLDHRKKVADLHLVIEAIESILPYLKRDNLIILESTVPPLTCREIITPLIERTGLNVGEDIYLAHCPERILPGDVFYEIVHNDRIIGGANSEARRRAKTLYASFVEGCFYETDDVTAELCKLLENTHRDVNIALANEFAAVAETLDIDAREAITLANKHPRVNILNPGIGVGGHCIPIDPWFIKEVDPANSRLIFAARLVNDEMPQRIAAKIRKAVREITAPKIVALGAAYKPDVTDMRESPAIRIVTLLREDGYHVMQYDPLVEAYQYDGTLVDVCRGADCVAILVEHDAIMRQFEENRARIEKVMRRPLILRF